MAIRNNTLSKSKLNKNLTSENNMKKRFKDILSNPFGQFFVLGIVLILLSVLAKLNILPTSLTSALASVVVYAIIAIGFCLLLGYSGLASLGTAGFAGIGAYCAFFAMQKLGMSFFTALILSVVVAIVIGVIVGFISLRIEGMYLAILTLGLAEILFELFLLINEMPMISRRNITFFWMELSEQAVFILTVILFVILLCITHNLINSPTGRAMLAMKNSTSAAQAMGISLLKYRLLAFVISTVYAAIGGMMYILLTTAISVTSSTFLALSMSLNILGAVIVGGSKSLWGTSLGVVLIFGLQSIFFINIPFFQQHPEFMNIVSGALIVLVVMFYPGGLAQLFVEIKGKIKKAIAKRRAKKYGTY